jgi:mono/diheme cytochrome c family protein
MKGFVLGLILGLLAIPVTVFIYFHSGHPPVAVADQPFLLERQLVRAPLHTRIEKEMPKKAPISASETNLMIGAQIYHQQCAACHGLYGLPSSFAAHMYPSAPQLWAPHDNGVVGVSDDPPGETFWKIKNGIRLTGMPAFDHVLNETQMWQVTILLANADKPIPNDVMNLLKQPLSFNAPSSQGPTLPGVK